VGSYAAVQHSTTQHTYYCRSWHSP
jgi:hypothetical protein